jgi:hypothetical protein
MNAKSIANLIPAKPGEVRNPHGKQKGKKNRSTIYREILEQQATALKLPKIKELMATLNAPEDISLGELIALKNSTLALNANSLGIKATEHVEDSAYGKIPQKSEISGPDGDSLSIETKIYQDLSALPPQGLSEIKQVFDKYKKEIKNV